MSGRTDIAKGRVEEAVGALMGSDALRRRGKTDQAVGRVKRTAQKATDRVVKKMRG